MTRISNYKDGYCQRCWYWILDRPEEAILCYKCNYKITELKKDLEFITTKTYD